MTEIIKPAATLCRRHLEWEFLTLDPEVLITFGASVSEIVAEFGGCPSLPPLKNVVAHVLPTSLFGRKRRLVPCVHWNTLHGRGRKEHYICLQPARLKAARRLLSPDANG
jgi:uracil-DNA glycosylase